MTVTEYRKGQEPPGTWKIGTTLYYATTKRESKQAPCPDCKGERKWQIQSPVGEVFEIQCPRCAVNHISDQHLSLSYLTHMPVVTPFTVRTVRLVKTSTELDVDYMSSELSGNIYQGDRCFPDEKSALALAQSLAELANSESPPVVDTYAKACKKGRYLTPLRFYDYQLESAKTKSAKEKESRWRWHLQWWLQDLQNCETIEEVKELLEKGDPDAN